MGMNIRSVLKGMLLYIPGFQRLFPLRAGGCESARYCYAVWMRHLLAAHEGGLREYPRVVAELGPGDSLGTGLAALLGGAESYYALDLVPFADPQSNLHVFDELVDLFARRSAIPPENEFTQFDMPLASYDFPHHILSTEHMARCLRPERVDAIRLALTGMTSAGGIEIRYCAPWADAGVVQRDKVDFAFSQFVMEHVDDLRPAYQALAWWVRPGGWMSHYVDYRCHGTASRWNGHWGYGDVTWRLIRGNRPYLLNRQPHSVHLALLQECGMEIVYDRRTTSLEGIGASRLARRFRGMSQDDLTTALALMQGVKRQG